MELLQLDLVELSFSKWASREYVRSKKFACSAREYFLTANVLKVHLCGPLHLHGPFHLYEALSLPCGPFTPI